MRNRFGFSLTELIVTITILGILGAVAFISYNTYARNARDAVRSQDVSNIMNVINLYQQYSGTVPSTTDGVNITYSGSTLWTQGIFGDTTKRILGKIFGPTKDPLYDTYYTYSVTENLKEYQLGVVYENRNEVAIPFFAATSPSLLGQAYADTPFSPLELSPKIWLDARDINGDGNEGNNPSNSSTISTWVNKSSAGAINNPTVTDGSIQYAATGMYGQPGVFIANNDGLLLNNSNITQGDIFYVVQNADPFNSNVDTNGIGLQSSSSNNTYIGYYSDYRHSLRVSNSPNHASSSPASTSGREWPFIYGFHTDNNNYTFYDTGNLISQGGVSSISGNQWAFNRAGYTNQRADFVVSEILIFDTKLSNSDRQKVEGYLAHRWGQNQYLPSSHPYRNTIPTGSPTPPPPDSTPDAFVLTDVTQAELSTEYISNTITVSGINTPASISISGGEYRVNGGSYTGATSQVTVGNTIQVRQTSSSSNSTPTSATLNVGGVTESFTVTTKAYSPPPDSTPDAFVLTDVTQAELSTEYISNTITVSGINSPTSISITGGEYRINSGSFVSVSGTVSNGDSVTVRLISSLNSLSLTSTILNIGGVSENFDVTTKDLQVYVSGGEETRVKSNVVVSGNYNGLILHSQTGSTHYIVASPSIIASDLSSTDIVEIINTRKLVYDGFENTPSTYENNIPNTSTGGFDFFTISPLLFQGVRSDIGSYGGLKSIDEGVRSTYNNFPAYENIANYLDDYSLGYLEKIIGDVIGINPIKPYYCSDIAQSRLVYNIAKEATITATPGAWNSYGTDGIANGIISTDGDLDYEYHSESGNASIEFEWETPRNIGYIKIYNRTGCCSSRLSGASIKLYNELGDIVYSHSLWDTSNDYVIDLDLEGIGELHNVKKLTIESVNGNYINIREVEIYLGGDLQDGIYKVDKDGPGGQDPYNVFCDMTTDGGGWTRIGENFINNGNFSGLINPDQYMFNDTLYNTLVTNVAPPVYLAGADVLKHTGDTTKSYQLYFPVIPGQYFAQEIRLSAWVKGTNDSIFYNTLNYNDGTSSTTFPDGVTSESDNGWKLQMVRIPVNGSVKDFTWDLGKQINGTFYVTGLKLEVYYK